MSTIEVKDTAGKKVSDLELANEVFGITPNIPVMHQCVRYLLAMDRQGTHSTKGRSEVNGGGRKPWRQKGTGRARQGSIRSPQWRGGGVVFGPTPRDHAFKMNRKEIKLAMKSALSAKLADNELVVVDKFDFEKPSTKAAVAFLEALGVAGKRVTIVLTDEAMNAALSFRNLQNVTILFDREIDTYFMLDNNVLILAQPVATRLGEVLA
ncbi:MAG: 50S ribosomal protein L4 [Coriobacteriales bacterium]|nr:50S ribosomal protein L4 [Coriobacteriales bacterium]